jgi:hypothetical protein
MGKIYQKCPQKYHLTIKFTKTALKIPNDPEIHQQGPPKCTHFGIFGAKNIPSGNPVGNWLYS